MERQISPDIIEKWLRAWSLSRKLPLPAHYKSGFMVNVGDRKQKIRYVFPRLNDDFIQLAETIDEPWVFLKVCASFEEFKAKIPGKWALQPQGYMMYCFRPMTFPDMDLPDEYRLEYDHYQSTFMVRIVTKDGQLASTGRVVLVDDLAVYDRISTEKFYRRKRLATFLMKELEKIAISNGISNNFLVATQEGRSLYESLGWKLYSLYTSVVIPG